MQAIYNTAQAAFDKEDWATAAENFTSIAAPPSDKPLSHSQAIIRARLAKAELQLGKLSLAISSGKMAATALDPAGGADAAEAWLTLADALRFNLEMQGAADAYDHAKRSASGPDSQVVNTWAELGTTFAYVVLDPAKAAASADAVVNDQASIKHIDKMHLAQIEALRGMAEANLGHPKDGMKYLRDAVAHSGGLSGDRASQLQITIRGDAATVPQLLHDNEGTHKYLAWTGAGHLEHADWISGAAVEPPTCNGAGDIQPDDTAVIQFAIDDHGYVTSAVPIYASRPGEMGIQFARTVKDWHWTSDAVVKMHPFWRSSLRLQIRCITRPPGLQLADSFYRATVSWFRSKNLPVGTIDADAPADVQAYFIYTNSQGVKSGVREYRHYRLKYLKDALPNFENRWPHTRANTWLHTELAYAMENAGDLKGAKPQLEAILAEPELALPSDDAIRRIVILHLAALKQHDGDMAGAKMLIDDAGITDQQCSLMDVRPVATETTVGSKAFPDTALRWGFNGFARTAFDIAADGSVIAARTVLSYPPFIFNAATEKAISKFRYLPPSIDGKALGCHGEMQTFSYKIAH